MTQPEVAGIHEDTGTKLYIAHPSEIFVREDRHRQTFKRKPLDKMITSMQEVGQLQPVVCTINSNNQIELLIGERRLKACMVLERKIEFILKENVKDELILEQMQLDENLCREALIWQEEIMAKAKLHSILQKRYGTAKPGLPGGHGLKDTAEHIGAKMSALHNDVMLASFLQVDEVAAAPNKTTALKIVKTLIKNVKRQEDLHDALAKESTTQPAPELSEEERAELKLKQRELQTSLIAQGKTPEEAKEQAKEQVRITPHTPKVNEVEKQIIHFNKRCLLGKMEEKIQEFPDEHFDIICFDPPWGVEFDKVFKESGTTKQYTDSKEAFFKEFPGWIQLIYQKMKPNSHLYMFFGIGQTPKGEDIDESGEGFEAFRYRDYIYDLLHQVGFKTNRMPLIWHKKGSHTTRNPLIWPGRSYEPIAYARKGSKDLALQGAPDVIITPMPTPSIKDIHPSAKHPKVYRDLLRRSAAPGDRILDPMAGSGMFAVAAESLRKNYALDWHMIEIDSDFRTLQVHNLLKGYEKIAEVSIKDQANIAAADQLGVKGFQELTPGTDSWIKWWKAHPEDQDAMIQWREKTGI